MSDTILSANNRAVSFQGRATRVAKKYPKVKRLKKSGKISDKQAAKRGL